MDEIRITATDEGTWRINQTATPFQELREALVVATRLAIAADVKEILVVARDGSKTRVPARLSDTLERPKRRARVVDVTDGALGKKRSGKVKQSRR